MPDIGKLIPVFEASRMLLERPRNDFLWSSWEDHQHALNEIDGILSALRSGVLPRDLDLEVLFAPTGPMQEVSLSSGWGADFLDLAKCFDDAMASEP